MDTPLKHRLTGAIILVLLAVIVIPELLTGERNPQAAAASGAAAPGSAAPLRSYDIDLTDAAMAPAPQPAAAPQAAAAPPLRSAAASQPPATGAKPPGASAAAPTPAPTPTAAAARAPTLRATTAASGEFFVQLGSFAARDSAERLAAEVRRKGFAVKVSATRSGQQTLHRVRVGPVGERPAANALAERLRAAGHTGRIVSGA